ncbi:MAG: hypothetical protein V1856_02645, partial [Candidatus Liptonbacteria bacterium]
ETIPGLSFTLGERVASGDDLSRCGDIVRYDSETFCLSFHREVDRGFTIALNLPRMSRNGFLAHFALPCGGTENLRALWGLVDLAAETRGMRWQQAGALQFRLIPPSGSGK